MDIQQPCYLCPRRLFQSGKPFADSFNLIRTSCDHYIHPVCWQRHYKKFKSTIDSSCSCPNCHKAVNNDGLIEISVSRGKYMRDETIQKENSSRQLWSPSERIRLQRAAAELEKRSQEKADQKSRKKVRTRKNANVNCNSNSAIILPRGPNSLGKY